MTLEFKPRARMLLQLGDQLIRSESIALLELVKNAYDANASKATVIMKDLESPVDGVITIEDDGDGMNSEIIRNVWMQPGSEYKEKLIESGEIDESKRIPIGGKGIGRFSVHKLGEKIEVISKKYQNKEIKITINWKDFEQDKLLKDVKIKFVENDKPEYFTGVKTGTRIVVRGLKNTWTRGTVRDLYRAINSLNSPFKTVDSFKTILKLDEQSWLEGLTSFKDIKDHALYFAEAIINNNVITKLNYEFRPWDTMTKLKPRKEILENTKFTEQITNEGAGKKEWVDLDLSAYKIGIIKLKILIFDQDSKVLSLGVSDKKGLKTYLRENGGIRVYRDGIRVYDYGEPGNDWLNINIGRVNQPGRTISNNIIIGAVALDRKSSADLQEKTNREGFIENKAYEKFVSAISFTINKIVTQRNIDKDKVRKFYSPSAVSEPVVGHLNILHKKVSEKVKDEELREDLLKSIINIEKDYETISEIYTKSSSAGLSLSIVIHEIIHMISELASAVEKKSTDSHIKQLVKTLQRTIGDYASVIKQTRKSKTDLVEITRQALSNIQFRIKAHKLEIVNNFEKSKNINTNVSCAKNLVLSTIINIIDNSIWWQNYAGVKKKKLFIDIIEYPEKYISLVIADNGPGFSIGTDEVVKPFISDKPGGMGLGLHLADEVMKGQKGNLFFPDPYDLDISGEFQEGAKLLLAFRKMI